MLAVSAGRFEAGLGAGWEREEAEAAGIDFPSSGERADRYAEAAQIVRDLLTTGRCSFQGRYYNVDVPVIGPRVGSPPPLVAALGGPRTLRLIGPIADRIEQHVISVANRGGSIDFDALAAIPRSHLDQLVAKVREVNETAPLSVFAMCSVAGDERTRELTKRLDGTFIGGFFGEPAKVAATMHGLADAGISRVQVGPTGDASFELLAPHLLGS